MYRKLLIDVFIFELKISMQNFPTLPQISLARQKLTLGKILQQQLGQGNYKLVVRVHQEQYVQNPTKLL